MSRRTADENQGAVSTTLAALADHPDAAVRARVEGCVDEWLESLRPRFSTGQVLEALSRQPGTPVEPFVLAGDDLRLTTIAIRAAFSRRGKQTRFRVVSADTLGTLGGLVLTNNLRGYLVERFALGSRRRTPWRHWFIAPAARRSLFGVADVALRKEDRRLPASPKPAGRSSASSALDGRRRALCTVTDTGWQVLLPPVAQASRLSAPPFSASVVGSGRELGALGVRVLQDGGRLALDASGPETVVRLGALASRRSWVVVQREDDDDDRPGVAQEKLYVRLLPLERERMELPCAVAVVSKGYGWLSFGAGLAPALPFADQLAVAQYYPVPDGWVTPAFLEALS